MMTDPIADMLTRIRNASAVRQAEVMVPYSRLKSKIADVLKNEGFIADVHSDEDNKMLNLSLRYIDEQPVITSLKRISRPGCRIYRGFQELPRVRQGLGFLVLSTSVGLLTDQQARQKKMGGELLFEVY